MCDTRKITEERVTSAIGYMELHQRMGTYKTISKMETMVRRKREILKRGVVKGHLLSQWEKEAFGKFPRFIDGRYDFYQTVAWGVATIDSGEHTKGVDKKMDKLAEKLSEDIPDFVKSTISSVLPFLSLAGNRIGGDLTLKTQEELILATMFIENRKLISGTQDEIDTASIDDKMFEIMNPIKDDILADRNFAKALYFYVNTIGSGKCSALIEEKICASLSLDFQTNTPMYYPPVLKILAGLAPSKNHRMYIYAKQVFMDYIHQVLQIEHVDNFPHWFVNWVHNPFLFPAFMIEEFLELLKKLKASRIFNDSLILSS